MPYPSSIRPGPGREANNKVHRGPSSRQLFVLRLHCNKMNKNYLGSLNTNHPVPIYLHIHHNPFVASKIFLSWRSFTHIHIEVEENQVAPPVPTLWSCKCICRLHVLVTDTSSDNNQIDSSFGDTLSSGNRSPSRWQRPLEPWRVSHHARSPPYGL